MNQATEHTPSESLNNKILEDGDTIYAPQNKLPFSESQVDLNEVFPDEQNDLNDLFPDEETKLLLKKIQSNKKELHTMTARFIDDNWSGIENEDTTDKDPAEPKKVTDNA
jgi:hypothetical protein